MGTETMKQREAWLESGGEDVSFVTVYAGEMVGSGDQCRGLMVAFCGRKREYNDDQRERGDYNHN